MSAPGGGGHADMAGVLGLGMCGVVSCAFGIYDPGILRGGWECMQKKGVMVLELAVLTITILEL